MAPPVVVDKKLGNRNGAAERRVGDFNTQELANTAWAFATADPLDAALFASLAREVKRRVNDFDAQGLANTAWAFVTAGQLDELLCAALATEAEQRVDDFNV